MQKEGGLIHFDLIIIGMGLSGLMAAKTAAEAGLKVLILGKGTGSLSLFSNTIDVLGGMKGSIEHGIPPWIESHPEHPYSKVGPKMIEESIRSFTSLFAAPYSFLSANGNNCWIPTGAGTFRETYLVPITMSAGTSLQKAKTLIIGFKGFKDFYPEYVADQLGCRGDALSLPEAFRGGITATAMARMMETETFSETLGKEIKKRLRDETRVGLPALLGLREPGKVLRDLEQAIGAQVFEIPTLPPSIPGMRIFHRFKKWLTDNGATFLLGQSVSEASVIAKRCEKIESRHLPISASYASDRYVLATGRFMGGGLRATEEEIVETIFHLVVAQPKRREEWFDKGFLTSTHPVHRAGVLTDPFLRPVNQNGELLLENVWVAGSMLAGHDFISEKSREGIEIATGYMAAKQALGS